MTMNKKLLTSLGAVSLASIGLIMGATDAQAVLLAPGELQLNTNAGLIIANNIVDFRSSSTTTLGLPGLGRVTTEPGSTNSGIFGGLLNAGRYFYSDPITPVTTQVLFSDFFADPTLIPAGSCGTSNGFNKICNNQKYSVATLTGGPAFAKLYDIDTDHDTTFGSGGDFEYYISDFTRTAQLKGGLWEVGFTLEGYFKDLAGFYEDTFTTSHIVVGTTSVDPNTLQVLKYDGVTSGTGWYPPIGNAVPAGAVSTAAINATLITKVSVPESSSVMGLLAFAGVGLGGFLKKKGNKEI